MAIEFRSFSPAAKRKMQENAATALGVMGKRGHEMVIGTMNKSYEKPIYKTGKLQRSITAVTDSTKGTVTWGTKLGYGLPVHEGTKYRDGRPFLRDSIASRSGELLKASLGEVGRGF